MTTITLKDLPAPPPNKTGWPWTEANEPLSNKMPDGSQYPLISIVTPSYNYGQFIEETIRSVLLQGYPNLEYIVIDGGSTDDTVEIIKKYEQYITYWESEPDKGQTDAINKGYQHCSGEIFAWLNSDDAYASNDCLKQVAELYRQGYQFIVGQCVYVDLLQDKVAQGFERQVTAVNFEQYLRYWSCNILHQPSVFIATIFTESCFPLDINLFYSMDYQFFLRALSLNPKAVSVDKVFAKASLHNQNKTVVRTGGASERYEVAWTESKKLSPLKRLIYRIASKDYQIITTFFNQKQLFSFWSIAKLAILRPSLLRWQIFWKIFLKSALGNNWYFKFKQIGNKS